MKKFLAALRRETTKHDPADRVRQRDYLLRMAGTLAKFGGWAVPMPPERVLWSDEVCDIHEAPHGFSPTIAEGIRFYAPEFQEAIRSAFEACLAHGTPFDMELQIVTMTGRRVWVRVVGEAVKAADGEVLQVQGAFQDISRHKQSERDLAESSRRVTNILASISDGFFAVDRDWRFLFLNAQAALLLGRQPEELLGKGVWDEFPQAVASEFYRAYHRAFEGQQVVRFEEFYPPLGKWFQVSAFPSPETLSVYFRDITAQKAAEADLRKRAEQQALIAAFSAKALSGAPVEELLAELVSVTERVLRVAGEAAPSRALASVSLESLVGDSANPFAWIEEYLGSRHLFRPEDADFLRALCHTLQSAMRRKSDEEKVAYLSQFDTLTNLPNRSLFRDRVAQMLARSRREDGLVAVMCVDLDRLRAVNDSFGHDAGDALLRDIAGRLERCVRAGDSVARLGSDEFGIAFPDLQRAEDAGALAAKIGKALSQPLDVAGQSAIVTASLGIALYPHDAEDAEALVKNADAAMHRAKAQGRNTYEFYRPEMNARAAERVRMESALRAIVDQGRMDERFCLHYQPKVDAQSGRFTGFEALLRWMDPAKGMVSPSEFIPVLEDTGLIADVGLWALHTAIRDYRSWYREGLAPPRIAVNVSSAQLRRPEFIPAVRRLLAEPGHQPAALDLEITESLIMHNLDSIVPKLRELKEVGIGIAIDDFGTGYSSLAYLAKLPVDALKIDRSFVATMAQEGGHGTTIVSTVISLARALNLRTVAEGVEQQAQAQLLRLLGCHELQGYLFGRPVPAAEAAALLRGRRDGTG